MDDKYRTLHIDRYGERTSMAVYANDKRADEVVVYITLGPFSCGLHMAPEKARDMARMLSLAADEAAPVALAA